MKKVLTERARQKRLSKDQRRDQLLETARRIVREEGVDSLTLGHLAVTAGISKPVIYDHFEDRSALLIALYRLIDTEVVNAFRDAIEREQRDFDETVSLLAETYIRCAAETDGEFQAVGAALAGSEEKAAVFQELLDKCVQMFVAVLRRHTAMSSEALESLCVGFVGAGEGFASALVRKKLGDNDAIATFGHIIRNSIPRSKEPE